MRISGPRVLGPLTVAQDLAHHSVLFVNAFGMSELATLALDLPSTQSLFGGDVGPVTMRLLASPGCGSGAIACSFSGDDIGTVRESASPVDVDALKVIDFYAPDLDAAVAHVRGVGLDVEVSGTPYSMDGVPLVEAHIQGPDGLRFAILGGPTQEMRKYVEASDRLISEVLGITSPVRNREQAVDFYADVFGWKPVLEYTAKGEALESLVGLSANLQVTGICMGSRPEETYVDLLDYGLPPEFGASLRDRTTAPHRGLLGLVVLVPDLAGLRAVAPPESLGVAQVVQGLPGIKSAAMLTPPWGIPHLVLETEEELPWPM